MEHRKRAKHYPHLNGDEVADRLKQLETAEDSERRDIITDLAWRPAWAIRSRRGTLNVLKEWISNRRAKNEAFRAKQTKASAVAGNTDSAEKN